VKELRDDEAYAPYREMRRWRRLCLLAAAAALALGAWLVFLFARAIDG
jgi:hypothetical protein